MIKSFSGFVLFWATLLVQIIFLFRSTLKSLTTVCVCELFQFSVSAVLFDQRE